MNSPASIRARLLNVSKQSGEDFQAILTRYAIERFLYRLGASEQRDAFILKGAMLFVAWQGNLHRPTKDLDLLGFGAASLEDVARRIREIARMPGDDGIAFDPDSVVTEIINRSLPATRALPASPGFSLALPIPTLVGHSGPDASGRRHMALCHIHNPCVASPLSKDCKVTRRNAERFGRVTSAPVFHSFPAKNESRKSGIRGLETEAAAL